MTSYKDAASKRGRECADKAWALLGRAGELIGEQSGDLDPQLLYGAAQVHATLAVFWQGEAQPQPWA